MVLLFSVGVAGVGLGGMEEFCPPSGYVNLFLSEYGGPSPPFPQPQVGVGGHGVQLDSGSSFDQLCPLLPTLGQKCAL